VPTHLPNSPNTDLCSFAVADVHARATHRPSHLFLNPHGVRRGGNALPKKDRLWRVGTGLKTFEFDGFLDANEFADHVCQWFVNGVKFVHQFLELLLIWVNHARLDQHFGVLVRVVGFKSFPFEARGFTKHKNLLANLDGVKFGVGVLVFEYGFD
jgi:hypothetical protein